MCVLTTDQHMFTFIALSNKMVHIAIINVTLMLRHAQQQIIQGVGMLLCLFCRKKLCHQIHKVQVMNKYMQQMPLATL